MKWTSQISSYRMFHPKTKEYSFFSEPHGTFSKIKHIDFEDIDIEHIDIEDGHKTTLDQYKKITMA